MASSFQADAPARAAADPLEFSDWLARHKETTAIPVAGPFYQEAAKFLQQLIKASGPDASSVRLIVPHGDARREISRELAGLPSAHSCLFGLSISTLREWALAQLPIENIRYCSDEEALLALAMRIANHGGVRFNKNHWQFSPALIDLFNQLEQNRIDDKQLDEAVKSKQSEWRLSESNYLAIEAEIAGVIWRAWRQDLRRSGYASGVQAYNEALDKHIEIDSAGHYLIVAPDEPLPAEQDFLRACLGKSNCRILCCDRRLSPAHSGFAALLGGESADSPPARARWLYQCLFKPTAGIAGPDRSAPPDMELLSCANEARQIEAIVDKCQRAKAEGRRVGIVVHNRRFARALRAAMDGERLSLRDRSGWALSTTFSGSVVKIWLNVINSGYGGGEVFNFIRTARLLFGDSSQSFFRSFDNLRRHLASHFQTRFAPDEPMSAELKDSEAGQWLARIHQAGAALSSGKASQRPLAEWCVLLEQSMEAIGLRELLLSDRDGSGAGALIIDRLRRFQCPALLPMDPLPWPDFLNFIDHQLEHNRYAPPAIEASVDAELIQLGNAFPRYDLLIFAAMELNEFPGRARADLLFNDDIYIQLGLPAPQRDRERKLLARFTESLLSHDNIVFAYNSGGDNALPCAWLAQIIDACERDGIVLAGESLLDSLDQQWLSRAHRPATAPARPRVGHGALAEPRLSVSEYQRLVDCPYQYFFSSRLGVRATPEISQIMRADVYGQIAHEAFRQVHRWLQESGALPLVRHNTSEASRQGREIVERLFTGWMRGSLVNMAHKLRLRRTISVYLDWLARENIEAVYEIEEKFAFGVPSDQGAALRVSGRVDFVLGHAGGRALVDFKSGSSGRTVKAISNGGDVQLLTYSLAFDEARDIYYLAPVSGGFQTPMEMKKTAVPPQHLDELRLRNRERLERIANEFARRHTLMALIDDGVCAYCDYQIVCKPRQWGRIAS